MGVTNEEVEIVKLMTSGGTELGGGVHTSAITCLGSGFNYNSGRPTCKLQ